MNEHKNMELNENLKTISIEQYEAYLDELIESCTDENGINEDLLINKLNEGVFGAIMGGVIGLSFGKQVGMAVAKVLGLQKNGALYNLLTSKVITTLLGTAIGSKY